MAAVSRGAKLLLVGLLCLQNALYSLLRRYSQGVLNETWNPSSTLLFGEFVKLVVATIMFTREPGNALSGLPALLRWKQAYKMFVPAFIYFVMNLLSFYALQRIDAGVFTVLGQLKILTTAVFTTVMLRRRVSVVQWRALFLLVLGCILVLYEASTAKEKKSASFAAQISGTVAMLIEVTMSGFASIWFEMVVKNKKPPAVVTAGVGAVGGAGSGGGAPSLDDGSGSGAKKDAAAPPSLWALNFQLSFWSILMYFPRTMLMGGHGAGGIHTLLDGWTLNALLVGLLGAAGGLLVALSIKYTVSLVKSLAVGGAIVLTTFFGWLFLGGTMDLPVWIGCACVILSMFNYKDG